MKQVLRWFVGLSYVPAGFAIFFFLHRAGLGEIWVFYLGTALLILMTHALEQWMPWERSWRHADDQLSNEIGHSLISALVGDKFGSFLAYLLIGAVVVVFPITRTTWWPEHWPVVVQVAIAFCVWDLGLYWNHRLMHGAAWKFHALHHKVRRISWLNSGYGHPVQFVMTSMSGLVLLYLCGLPDDVFLYTAYMTFTLNFLPHANIDMEMGFLNYIFATPRAHRWHHSSQGRKAVNFGLQLSIWDIVFRTFYLPKEEFQAKWIGNGMPLPAGFFAQWLEPFVPKRIKSRWSPIPRARQPFTLRTSISRNYEAAPEDARR